MIKRSFLVVAAVGSFASAAHAQSSVTLYGLIDDGFVYNTNSKGAHQYSLGAGNLQGDRWGLRGDEDLGGGLHAIFRLEGGFSVNTGALSQGGAEFGRKAYVGLSGNFGTVTLGRQYDATGDYVGEFESANNEHAAATEWGSIYGAHPSDMDNLDNSFRINNTVKFASQDYGGFNFGGIYSLGGQAGNFTGSQLLGVGAGYHYGALSLGTAYEKAKDPNYSVFGTNPSANTVTSASASNMSSPVISGYASASQWQVITAGAAYVIGKATIGGVYSNVQFQNLGSEAGAGLNPSQLTGTATFNIGELNVSYLLTPSVQLGAAYTHTKGSAVGTISGASYNQMNLGLNYLLSKRTDLYAVGIYEHASGVDSTGKTAVAAITNLSASTTSNQTALVFGIRHKF